MEGSVVSIAIASKAGLPMRKIATAHLVPDKGIEGDRFYAPLGRKATGNDDTCDVTLIEQEAIASASSAEDTARRNIVVRGCRLHAFVGRTFRIGDVLLQGLPPHEACSSEDVSQQTQCMVQISTSLRARILTEGTIGIGDHVQCL